MHLQTRRNGRDEAPRPASILSSKNIVFINPIYLSDPPLSIRRVRRPRRRIIRRADRQDLELNGAVAFAVRARLGPDRLVSGTDLRAARLDVEAADHAVEERARYEWLVERHLVAGLVDAHERVFTGLLDLPVHDVVVGRDVGVPGGRISGRGDEIGDGLVAEPVAVVVCEVC